MAFGKSILKAGIITAVLATTATAQTLPLPDNLINLDSGKGSALLQESEALQSYWPLSIQFVTQKNQAFCGVASIVMVLNALGIPAPTTPEFEPYRTFTQENVFTPATETILPQATVLKMGMTLDQIGAFIATYAVKAKIHHASDSSLEEFRKLAKEYLNASGHHVIVNYLRKSMGQEKGGHISPLAAYDADTDRFLILDVARYKYPPVWVSAADLFAAMNTTDSENQNRTRGFVLLSR
jgi:glutathione-S-conjugate glycine hydrolase